MSINSVSVLNPQVMPPKKSQNVSDEHAAETKPVVSGFISGTESYFYKYPEKDIYSDKPDALKNANNTNQNRTTGQFVKYSYYVPLNVLKTDNKTGENNSEKMKETKMPKSDLSYALPINPFANVKPVEKVSEPQKVVVKNPEAEKSVPDENSEPNKVSYKGSPTKMSDEKSEGNNVNPKNSKENKTESKHDTKVKNVSQKKMKPEIVEPDREAGSSSALPVMTVKILQHGSDVEKANVLNRMYYVALNSPEQSKVFTTKEIFDSLEGIVKNYKHDDQNLKNKTEALLVIGMLSGRVLDEAKGKTGEEIRYDCLPGTEFLKETALKSPYHQLRQYAVKALSLTYAPQFDSEIRSIMEKTSKDTHIDVRKETEKVLKSFEK